MKKTLLNSLTICTLFFATALNAQVGIGVPAENIHPSAELEVKSTTKGFLPPRMTKAQRDAIVTPAAGLLIYQTDGDENNTTTNIILPPTSVTPIGNNVFVGPIKLRTIKLPPAIISSSGGTGATGSTSLSSGPGLYYFDGTSWKNVVGAQGATGAQGIQGETGAVGPKGDQGAQGLQGPKGDQGGVTSKIYTIGLWPELGGYVFKISADGTHGLVAETQDQSVASSWYLAQDAISNPVNHSTNGQKFMDWRLPTKYELNEMYLQKGVVGGFVYVSYWSSTEYYDYSGHGAWLQNFSNGNQYTSLKGNDFYLVRSVRAF